MSGRADMNPDLLTLGPVPSPPLHHNSTDYSYVLGTVLSASPALNPHSLGRKYYYPHFTDGETEKQVIKFKVLANKLSQVSNLGLSRNLKLVTLNCLWYIKLLRALTFNSPRSPQRL